MKAQFWAYAIESYQVTIVGFASRAGAVAEKDRLKFSTACAVGCTPIAVTEQRLRDEFKARGLEVTLVR